MTFKPMLSSPVDFKHVEWDNLLLSPKYDGIRAVVLSGRVMSRSLKSIPNQYIQLCLGQEEFEGLDGELIVGPPHAKDVYTQTESGVMSVQGTPDFTFYVFDQVAVLDTDYENRLAYLRNLKLPFVKVVPQIPVRSMEDVLHHEQLLLDMGFEGVMLRKARGPSSHYKTGRATPKQGNLLKLKRFTDDEAVVVGVEEELANTNEATINELGLTERSSHMAGRVGKGRLGALRCKWKNGLDFNIGTGFNDQQRDELWAQRGKLVGKLVVFKYFEPGTIERPRHPVFKGWRSPIDM